MNISIIGAGNIGKRHVESCVRLSSSYTINVIENNEESLLQCKANIGMKDNFIFERNLPKGQIIDLLFLATTSQNRFEIFLAILKNNVVNNVIFEKVVFQKPLHYLECEKLLKEKNIKGWINTWPRQAKFFADIRNYLTPEKKRLKVYGNKWGLACNATHYIDLFNFFSGEISIKNIFFKLEKTYHAKRDGFIDFRGHLLVENDNEDTIEIIDNDNLQDNLIVEVNQKKFWCKVTDNGKFVDTLSSNDSLNMCQHLVPLQSKTSSYNIENILKKNKCSLPETDLSFPWHKKLIEAFNLELGLEKSSGLCPIT